MFQRIKVYLSRFVSRNGLRIKMILLLHIARLLFDKYLPYELIIYDLSGRVIRYTMKETVNHLVHLPLICFYDARVVLL